MKKLTLITSLFFIFLWAEAQQENIIKVDSKIDEITLYMNGAEIRQSKEIKLKKGRNKVVFQGLSTSLQPNSVQVTVGETVEILSVSTETDFLNIEKLEPRINQLKDSIESLKDLITSVNNQIDAFNAEKAILTKNQYIGGQQTGVSIIELQKATDFYRDRTLEINKSLSKLEKQLAALNKKVDLFNGQLQELNYKNNPERKNVILVLSSAIEQSTPVKIRYIVNNAAWAPTYDLIAKDINKPIDLKYKARVLNNTGINWDNVKLKLSTGDPSLSASKPTLTAWTLNYSYDDYENKEGYVQTQNTGVYDKPTTSAIGGRYENTVNNNTGYNEVEVAELSSEFDIKEPYDIPSDAKPYIVDVTSYTLDAIYEYFTIPKVDRDAFLLAKVIGWEKLNLVSGPVNVYYGGTYIGESSINTRYVEDTLDISLGRDNKILVTRTKKEDFSSKKIIALDRKESFTYEIIIKNNRTEPIDIELQDQVPVSQENEIKVEIDEISSATMDALNGKLHWNAKINPGESVKYTIAFSVKYPKNKTVHIRKTRAIPCMSF